MAESRAGDWQWFTADPRAVLPLDPFHVPRRLVRQLRSAPYTYTTDRAFPAVIRACADRPDTWISEELERSYVALHRAGHAHSVEVWRDGTLAGGLYGVHLGSAFFGESVFRRDELAAKAALVFLGRHLQSRGFRLLEIQMITPFTAGFGARLVRREEYSRLLREALATSCSWSAPDLV